MEFISIVDENNELTGEILPRNIAHEKGYWHRSVHIWIVNGDDRILLQKRSNIKDPFPGCWDISCVGHIKAGDSSIMTVVKEMEEELSITLSPSDSIEFVFTLKNSNISNDGKLIDNEFNDVYVIKKDFNLKDLVLKKSEVKNVKSVSINTLVKMSKDTSNLLSNYTTEIEMLKFKI